VGVQHFLTVLSQIIPENVNESFYRLKVKACVVIREYIMQLFEGKSFKERTEGKK
jgi:hypothetical protein